MGASSSPNSSGAEVGPRPAGHRADIQALRAVAALLVVIFHLWPQSLTGGYVGVDVFFVISGFLITSHLLREAATRARIGLARFWARRARRLLPSALLVLVFTAVVTWVWVPEIYFEQFFTGIAASALYVENWSLARDAVDYLAEDNLASPTQHYWTLSVEEQFYIVWPLLVGLGLWAAHRVSRRPRPMIFGVLAVFTLASFFYSLRATELRPEAAFFVTPARAWEFGAGALLAFVAPAAWGALRGSQAAVLAWAGLGVVLWCAWRFDADTAMPGTAALLVVLGACLFIAGGSGTANRWSPGRVLDVRPIQFTGDISYSLYLWHWPLIILLPFVQGHPNGPRSLVGIFVLTFALAAFSTYLVENPIRYSSWRWLRQSAPTLGTWLTAAAVLASVCVVVVLDQSEKAAQDRAVAANFLVDPPRCAGAASMDPQAPCHNPRLDRILVPSLEAVFRDRPRIEGQNCASRAPGEPIIPCTGGRWEDPDLPHVVIIGDSHARMMTTALEVLADDGVLAWKGYFQSGCILTSDPPVRIKYTRECNSFKERLPAVLAPELDRVDFVITTGRASKLDGTIEQKARGLTDAWQMFADRDIPVVALSDVPEIGRATACLSEHPRDRVDACARKPGEVLTEPDPFIAAADDDPNAHGIDMQPHYCTTSSCPAVIGGVVVYADANHLSATYVATLAPILKRELTDLGLLTH